MRTISEIIELKRDGGELDEEDIRAFVAGVTDGTIPDYQTTAWLMAVYFQGMTAAELGTLTAAMIDSGDRLDIPVSSPKVDKHSTGGVGDKISIPLAPLAAACGLTVPMISGRGLGHGGGTLDKLEAIPGFRTVLEPDEFTRLAAAHGVVMAGQSERIVPADRALYALRDTTATVASVPLISASIMSKKLAENLDGLVLDVKVGQGAFMRTVPEARRLAGAMTDIGRAQGVPTRAFLTAMDQPLGRAVGNANEVAESIAVLRGEGPQDVTELVLTLGEAMLESGGVSGGRARMEDALASGSGLDKFAEMVAAQGGDPAVAEDPSRLPSSPVSFPITAPRSGWVTAVDAREVGMSALLLGAGRRRAGEALDHGAGIVLQAKAGDRVERGQVLAVLTHGEDRPAEEARRRAEGAFTLGEEPPDPGPLIIDRVG